MLESLKQAVFAANLLLPRLVAASLLMARPTPITSTVKSPAPGR